MNEPRKLAVLLTPLLLPLLAGGCNRRASAQPPAAKAPASSNANPNAHPQPSAAPPPGNGSAAAAHDAAGNPANANASQEMQKANSALAQIDQAVNDIHDGSTAQAEGLLQQSANTLRALYENVPGRSVVNQMNTAHTKNDYAPLMTTLATEQVYLDPQVVANVKQAQQHQQAGNQQQAQQNLQLARDKMIADVALLPVEDAFSRVVAARSELQAGRTDNALELLNDLPLMLTQVQVSAPLVPVRFDLRAAADAAQHGDWSRATQLLDQADKQLQAVAAAGQGSKQASQLKPLVNRADQLSARADSKQKPRPREINALADELRKHSRTM
jgi:hypothetical protein